jgi:hypothetical protein
MSLNISRWYVTLQNKNNLLFMGQILVSESEYSVKYNATVKSLVARNCTAIRLSKVLQ